MNVNITGKTIHLIKETWENIFVILGYQRLFRHNNKDTIHKALLYWTS